MQHSMIQVVPHPAEVAEDLPFGAEKAGRVWKAPMLMYYRVRQYWTPIQGVPAKGYDCIEGRQGVAGGLQVIKGF